MEKRRVYFDHIATTFTHQKVIEGMLPYFTEIFGNPSSLFYEYGQRASKALDAAREKVARLIGANPEEIVFTSGATESNNMAIKGIAWANEDKGKHIIISEIEHFSVINPARSLNKFGFEVILLPVDGYGLVDPERLRKVIRKDTILVSIMHANNEIGTIQNISELSKITREHGIPFHTDAVGSVGHIPVNISELGVDMLTMSGHSFYGPKGIGALWIRKGIKTKPLLDGGFQELGYRSGTENVPGAVGMAVAAELALEELPHRTEHLKALKEKLWKGLEERIEFLHFTGHQTQRLPGHISFWIEHAEGESLLLSLALRGIFVASGSACSSNIRGETEEDIRASHVLTAVGVPNDICSGSITISMGYENTMEDVEYFLDIFPGIIERLWAMSPSYEDEMKKRRANK